MEVRTARRVQAMLDAMDPQHCGTILELGCGTGDACHLLASCTSAEVLGVDLCASFIQSAQERFQRPNLKFAVMDLLQEDLAGQVGGPFDYIVGNGILHHLRAELPVVLPRLKKLLAPRGRLIFWEPNLVNPYVFLIFKFAALRRLARLEPGEMAFTRGEIEGIFLRAGFSDVRVSCRDFLVPNTPRPFIKPVILAGGMLERIPGLSHMAQSVFVSAGDRV